MAAYGEIPMAAVSTAHGGDLDGPTFLADRVAEAAGET